MDQITETLNTDTNGPGLYEITRPVVSWCKEQAMQDGLLTLFIQHTSASLTIQENADPDVCLDLHDFFNHIAPQNGPYRHTSEGPDEFKPKILDYSLIDDIIAVVISPDDATKYISAYAEFLEP